MGRGHRHDAWKETGWLLVVDVEVHHPRRDLRK